MEPVIDLTHLEILGGHRDPELRELFDDFFADLSLQLADAETLLAKDGRSPEEMRDLAHKIRGISGSLGFKPLSRLAASRDTNVPEVNDDEWVSDLREAVAAATAAWNELIDAD